MENMLATLPRGVSGATVSTGCLPAQDLASGGQMGGGFIRSNQDDPRCNGTLRKQASPRAGTLGPASALTTGQGKAQCFHQNKAPLRGIIISSLSVEKSDEYRTQSLR